MPLCNTSLQTKRHDGNLPLAACFSSGSEVDSLSWGVLWGTRDLQKLVAMAAGPGGWLAPAFGLRLLIASVLHVVSGNHLRDSPRANGPVCEPYFKRVEGLGFLSRCCGRNVTWLMSWFDAYLSLLRVSNGSLYWLQTILNTYCLLQSSN